MPDLPDPNEFFRPEELRDMMRVKQRAIDMIAIDERDPALVGQWNTKTLDLIYESIGDALQRYAILLRRQPAMAERIADYLDMLANELKAGVPPEG